MRHRLVSGASFVAVALVVACAVLLTPDRASACSCGFPAGVSPQELVREELSYSDTVFAGEVIDIDEPLISMSSAAPMTVTFRVSEAWKGAGGETVDVQTAVSDASCGYPFDENESYLVFASEAKTRNAGELEVALCGSTKPISDAGKALAALGPGAAPTDATPAGGQLPDTGGRSGLAVRTPTPLLASAAMALVLVVASVWLAARGRARR